VFPDLHSRNVRLPDAELAAAALGPRLGEGDVLVTLGAGGDEVAYLTAFLDERVVEMKKEAAHSDVSRIESAQRRFLGEGNLDLHLPIFWSVYGDPYQITG
jgi:hypothetical protein